MQRWVLHIDMDAFFASCEQLTRPTLRGRPVLVAGVSGRGVVAGASYEARALGARSAMPTWQARKLIGFRGVVVAPRFAVYKAASARVFEILRREAAVVEQVSIDEAFLEPAELVGASAEEVRVFANTLRATIRKETGLPSSVGAGAGKQVAKISSDEAKPDGVFIVEAARHEEIIHPMAVGKLWGVGPVTRQKLALAGVDTIGQLAGMTEKEAIATLGAAAGRGLWLMARGVDEREVAPRAEAKQISAEHTYDTDLRTKEAVDEALHRAAAQAHRRLLADGRVARTVTVKLRMADFHIESRSLTLPYATSELKTLEATALKLVRYPNEVGAIRLVGVSFSGLSEVSQDVLFPELDLPTQGDPEPQSAPTQSQPQSQPDSESEPWRATQDVSHPEYGHGWIQGIGHGKLTVRFETRTTALGQGKTKTFDVTDSELQPADPLDSLDWKDLRTE
ncbi:DNA polymerase IV [Corynebacterium sp. 153RC1]|uniref:DNA polymerase IV n=1 Tax=unclassified Corynebacterium TaxID=2624378 RepID=UPI00211BEE2E|nr:MULTISPECIES: DNA polymerase IV [unclassified Corynebacterium]MCQ9369790.1 DNA polymerase IV [Corynebacterium sp. 35RC1]MCQ9352236.1 DNA polymerase IV [Corynebacterium sp. 209RC1]MCQ9355460.1 DNA polymerase IV [Corynebacterium sp. 1222RC1]MCQ9356656.1 DNA polymerase IV [Corynebacterium sp. 122RC1]MCQ9359803.1 DNA polymerase IV [Corynebacterium sp. 142RC1]